MSEAAKPHAKSAQTRLLAAAPYLLPVVIAVIALGLQNPANLVVILTDGAWPAALVISAVGWGAWPATRLLRDAKNRGQEIAFAAAIGFAILAAATLALGVLGFLNYTTALGLVATGAILGLFRLASKADSESWKCGTSALGCPLEEMRAPARVSATRQADRSCFEPHLPARAGQPRADVSHSSRLANLPPTVQQFARFATLLPLAIPIYVALSGAALPPGVLWRGEAGGYDVLEYHLQVQREYFESGRIAFLPHNVYASFPQQVEILYLLLMHLVGSPIDAAIPAQLLHVLFGGLAIAALAAWLPAGWPRVCGVAVLGSTPWLAYLGCLAYVENGMLFFAAIAFGIVAGWVRGVPPTVASAIAAGLCAGLAGGCKYTALAFVAGAGGLSAFFAIRQPLALKLRLFGGFFAAALIGVLPWLIRNAVFTGNPVYPLAYSLFGGTGWSAEQANQWSHGHAVSAGRTQTALNELFLGKFGGFEQAQFGATLFGLLPIALGLGLLLLALRKHATREVIFWISLATLIVIAWALSTQVAGRLAVPVVIPLAALVALTAEKHRKIGVGFALAASICGAAMLLGTWTDANRDWKRRVGVALGDLAGQSQLLVQNHPYNALLPGDARPWLVGDAAVFYMQRPIAYFTAFNRDPWLEHARGRNPRAAIRWLLERGVTHVVFNWGEIERLRRTYGFSDQVSRDWVRELETAGLARLAIPREWAASLQSVDIYGIARPE